MTKTKKHAAKTQARRTPSSKTDLMEVTDTDKVPESKPDLIEMTEVDQKAPTGDTTSKDQEPKHLRVWLRYKCRGSPGAASCGRQAVDQRPS
jgi:hypothetical protein